MSVTPLTQFIRASDNVVKFIASFHLLNPGNRTVFNLENQSTELQDLWGKVKDICDKCIDYFMTLDGTTTDEISSADSIYQSTCQNYIDCLSEINAKLLSLRSVKSPPATPTVINVSTPQSKQ